ncbi:MAG: hypothetical protein PVF41_08810 [Methyloceanibacter sp.]|jgi:hypothetical protein
MRFGVLLVLGFATGLAVFGTTCLRAEQMAWTVDSYPSNYPGQPDTVILAYGIPDTDAVAFEAICGGPDGATPRVVLWYDTVDLAEDQDVSLVLSVGDVTEETVASVYGKYAEVGVSGLEITLVTSAPIWQAMSNGGVLTYRVPDGQEQTLQLDGAASALREFTQSCNSAVAPSTADHPTAVDAIRAKPASVSADTPRLESVSCSEFGKIKSERSEKTVKITFVNRSDGYRGVVWIDVEGLPIDNTGLNQGEKALVPTFQSHAWMITDGPGNCIEMVLAGDDDGIFEIEAPSPVLGEDSD